MRFSICKQYCNETQSLAVVNMSNQFLGCVGHKHTVYMKGQITFHHFFSLFTIQIKKHSHYRLMSSLWSYRAASLSLSVYNSASYPRD